MLLRFMAQERQTGLLLLQLKKPKKAKEKLGWIPKITFKQLVTEMVKNDLSIAKRDQLVGRHGYSVSTPYPHE